MSRRTLVILGLASLVLALSAASLIVGRTLLPLGEMLARPDDPLWAVLVQLRLPRTLLALLIGAGLGLSGAALQGYTRNPLADPGVLGVSSCVALGAVLTLWSPLAFPLLQPLAAMAGALAGVGLLLALSGGASSMTVFLLAGVVLNTIAGAGVALALSLAPTPWAVNGIIDWLMGSLADRSLEDVAFTGPFILGGGMLLVLTGRALDALTLGETGAASLGIRLARTRALLGAGTALAVGAGVAVAGVIGFAGLVTPHLLRPLVGARPSGLLWPSALGGAAVVLAGDLAVRLTPSAAEVRLGVAMACLGGPFFLFLLLSLRRRMG
ncbi:MAG: FecCD family ABC transporter permease [Phenylobacterium sp.]